jgi:CRP/FNR family cyclic AMP-dependent transcriptional regulator
MELTVSIAAILKQVDIFYDFSQSELELIASICTEKEYKQGDTIFEENSTSDELYVIISGEVEIQVSSALIKGEASSDKPQTIAVIRRGQSFGEMALLDEGRRSAAARCGEEGGRLLAIPRDKLISLCETYPHLGYKLMYNLAIDLSMKIRNADLQIREQLEWTHGGSSVTNKEE